MSLWLSGIGVSRGIAIARVQKLHGADLDAPEYSLQPGEIDAEVARFAGLCRGQTPLLNMFLQMQLAAVAADGEVHAEEHALLLRIARGLGLSEADVQRLEAALRGGGGTQIVDRRQPLGIGRAAEHRNAVAEIIGYGQAAHQRVT